MTGDPMDDVTIEDVVSALDLALIEWLPDGGYRPLSDITPQWFKGTVPWRSVPFLGHFVAEARRYLHDHIGGVIASDQFAVQSGGDELLLRARALKVSGRLVLIIERLIGAADVRPVLREAREQALHREELTRKAHAVHRPFDAVARAAEALERAGVPGEQQPALDALNRAIASLREAVAALPTPPPRRRR
jgi:hypothetical protein